MLPAGGVTFVHHDASKAKNFTADINWNSINHRWGKATEGGDVSGDNVAIIYLRSSHHSFQRLVKAAVLQDLLWHIWIVSRACGVAFQQDSQCKQDE